MAAGALLASAAARGQPKSGPARIGVLARVAPLGPIVWQPFTTALRAHGWSEGSGFVVEQRSIGRDPEQALRYARELAYSRVDVILAFSTMAAIAAKQATSSIPIIAWCGYPVESRLARSLASPGGNVTGIANYAGGQMWGKFPQLLREVQPWLQRVGVLWDYVPPAFPDGEVGLTELRGAASRLGVQIRPWLVASEDDLGIALSSIEREKVEALIICSAGTLIQQREASARVAELLRRRSLPAITDLGTTTFRNTGCVLAYSPSIRSVTDRLANFIDRILRGDKPADLPFESPTRFELLVNAGAARTLGIKVPQLLLARADQVID